MSEQLTREEIESLRVWRMRDIGMQIHPVSQVLIVDYMLQLHDERERLRNLQAADVTEEQRTEWLGTPWLFADRAEMHREMIAAAVRVMLGGLDNSTDSA